MVTWDALAQIMKEDDANWPPPDLVGRQELEIILGEAHISFTTTKLGSLMQVQQSKDPDGLRIFYYLVQARDCCAFPDPEPHVPCCAPHQPDPSSLQILGRSLCALCRAPEACSQCACLRMWAR